MSVHTQLNSYLNGSMHMCVNIQFIKHFFPPVWNTFRDYARSLIGGYK